jgi:tRNA(fMet)-specific endonuclease VapC
MLHLLDTDTASYIIKQHSPGAREKLDALEPRQVAISAVTQAELLYGLQRLSPGNRLHLVVREFLDATQVLAWPAEAAEFYAQMRLRATLVTNNTRHYSRIAAPLILTNWIDEQDV